MKRIPKGLDQQGRYPEAAECCTEVGAEDEPPPDLWRPLQDFLIVLAVIGCLVAAFLVGQP